LRTLRNDEEMMKAMTSFLGNPTLNAAPLNAAAAPAGAHTTRAAGSTSCV
jgi:hypothetical protein